MKAQCFLKVSEITHPATQCHIPEDVNCFELLMPKSLDCTTDLPVVDSRVARNYLIALLCSYAALDLVYGRKVSEANIIISFN
jgi:hypothetical protein